MWILAVVWPVTALLVGLFIGRVIWLRDQQRSGEDPPEDSGAVPSP